jgi:hypothetical protein
MLSSLLRKKTIDDVAVCDGRLQAFGCAGDGRDIETRLVLGDGRRVVLRCASAASVRVALCSGSRDRCEALSSELRRMRVGEPWRVDRQLPPRSSNKLECRQAAWTTMRAKPTQQPTGRATRHCEINQHGAPANG